MKRELARTKMRWWRLAKYWIASVWNGWPDWRVIYTDGQVTRRLRKPEACELAKIFGGIVIYDPFL